VVVVRAVDTAANEAQRTATYRLAPRPVVIEVSRSEGPTAGGTELIVEGKNFVVETATSEGSKLLIDGRPIPATVTPTEIRALTLPHDPGTAKVEVTNGQALSASPAPTFEFVAPPRVREVWPSSGPVTGGTWIAIVGNHFRDGKTAIWIGYQPLLELRVVNTSRVEGRVPAGDAAGTVAVVAGDVIGGPGSAAGTFTYQVLEPTQAEPPDDGLAAPPTGAP
jgi:hypothetical protein